MGWMKKDSNGNVIDGYGMRGLALSRKVQPLVRLLRSNGVDCSEVINETTIHIFKYDATERELRELLGDQMTNYKLGVYGSINSTHHKGIYHEIEVKPNRVICGK